MVLGSQATAEDAPNAPKNAKLAPVHAIKMKSLQGKEVDFAKYQGKVLLIVNVASECGLTGQYQQLQALHKKYAAQGLAVLGVPCNQFGSQEPGTEPQIAEFCKKNYGVEFDMFAKVDVNGDAACPLYKHLTAQTTKPKAAGAVAWNFEKFLVDRQGTVIGRFDPDASPDDAAIVDAIEKALK